MVKSAAWAVPDGEQKAPEGRKNWENNNPEQAEIRTDAQSVRAAFAKSICLANGYATLNERSACDDGVPCSRLSLCLGQADVTLRYLEQRRSVMKKT